MKKRTERQAVEQTDRQTGRKTLKRHREVDKDAPGRIHIICANKHAFYLHELMHVQSVVP